MHISLFVTSKWFVVSDHLLMLPHRGMFSVLLWLGFDGLWRLALTWGRFVLDCWLEKKARPLAGAWSVSLEMSFLPKVTYVDFLKLKLRFEELGKLRSRRGHSAPSLKLTNQQPLFKARFGLWWTYSNQGALLADDIDSSHWDQEALFPNVLV